jgi:hypothetical protein
MAILAALFQVGTRQCKTGKVVIKFIFIETDDLEIFPVVVAVAGNTILPPDPR